jgi:hypothetical protein
MKSLFRAAVAVMTLTVLSFAGSVSVTSPANGSTVSSPASFVASATSTSPITAMRIYVDNVSAYTVNATSLKTTVAMPTGTHNVIVQAWDATGAVFKTPLTVKVATPPTTSTVVVTSPLPGSTVTSPAHFVASSAGATAMKIYVDNKEAYTINAAALDTNVVMTAGAHSIVVQSWNSAGTVAMKPLTLTVSSPAPPPPPPPTPTPIPSTARSWTDIEQMPGWENCTVCAGINANGPTAPVSMTQNVATPSLDGKSTQFWIGGTTPYSDGLWWKQLGGDDVRHHFVYDLNFYLTTPQYAQALEFDVNQSNKKNMYIMAVQCNIKAAGGGHWDVWNGLTKHWISTGVGCTAPSAYTWHHLTEEFQRDDSGNITFVAITLDGVKHYINKTYGSLPKAVSEINVAVQIDGDSKMDNFSEWVDKVTLYAW